MKNLIKEWMKFLSEVVLLNMKMKLPNYNKISASYILHMKIFQAVNLRMNLRILHQIYKKFSLL
jgi:hypothetical protein